MTQRYIVTVAGAPSAADLAGIPDGEYVISAPVVVRMMGGRLVLTDVDVSDAVQDIENREDDER